MDELVRWLAALLVTLWVFVGLVQGHGLLMEPPSRSSMWRLGYNTPKNYEDNQLSCGGVEVQFSPGVNGKCGVCGDPWNGKRKNEAGGKYATGTLVRKYDTGQVIDVTVDLTANHKGYFEFRLCPTDNSFENITWDCLNEHLLKDASTGQTKHMIESEQYYNVKVKVKLRLPKGIRCKACVLQWKYNGGNRWGTGPDGIGCVGCGNQEQFYACADVAIGHDDVVLGQASLTLANIGHSVLGRQSLLPSVLCLSLVSFLLYATRH